MMKSEKFKEALEHIPEKFMLANVLSKRVRQLKKGSEPLIPEDEVEGLTNIEIAIQELNEGKLTLVNSEPAPKEKEKKKKKK